MCIYEIRTCYIKTLTLNHILNIIIQSPQYPSLVEFLQLVVADILGAQRCKRHDTVLGHQVRYRESLPQP